MNPARCGGAPGRVLRRTCSSRPATCRRPQQQRQRRHDRPLRLEGAEQVERDESASCQFKSVPNGISDPDATTPIGALSAVARFSFFMRLLAPPTPSTDTPGGATSIAKGNALFSSVGCAFCHTPTLTTGNAAIAALRNQPVNLFSDLLIHNMGAGLADGVTQGGAGAGEFRTAPLWGLGQRIFFLHDGRTSNLITAILNFLRSL
jgi:CxxC motif-containing protein (DUF1111 family)